jgi:hypothetical protein
MNQKTPIIIILVLVAVLIGVIAFQVISNQPIGPQSVELEAVVPKPSMEPTISPIPWKDFKERQGPFQIGFLTTQKVFVELFGFEANGNKGTYKFSIIAENGVVLYYEDYPQGWTVHLEPVSLPSTKGAIFLVEPYFGNWVEGTGHKYFIGFRQDGSFGPITSHIEEMEAELEGNIEIIEYKEKEKTIYCAAGYSATGNFAVIRYIPLYFDGAYEKSPKFIEMDEYPVRIDEAKAVKLRKDATIHLYKAALLKAEAKPLKIRRDSKVKFLGAKHITREDLKSIEKKDPNLEWWLHVIIDGEEGYIINRKELVALGLEFQARYDSDELEYQ